MSSFRDPCGYLFFRDGTLYRQINHCFARRYEAIKHAGLYEYLWEAGLLIRHQECGQAADDPLPAYAVLEPEPVPFISYPYEWCFSALRDAALTTLRIQRFCVERGFTLRDASAYNIQFHNGRPILIDTLSIEPIVAGKPWAAYRQFCQHFLAPLALMTYRDVRMGRLLASNIDGIPLDLARRLLPRRSLLNAGLAVHLHMHARAQSRTASEFEASKGASVSKNGALAMLEMLEGAIRGLRPPERATEWGDYYDKTNYSSAAFDAKADIVRDAVRSERPQMVWDLGANNGRFSRVAAERSKLTISLDIDPAAVESNYLQMRDNEETNLVPLLFDLANPSPNIGWANAERQTLAQRGPADMVIALALIHHLAIGNNVPLDAIARYLASIGRVLLIEFVPKSDSQVARMLATREDVFQDYNIEGFERAFGRHFAIESRHPIEGSQRCIHLMRK